MAAKVQFSVRKSPISIFLFLKRHLYWVKKDQKETSKGSSLAALSFHQSIAFVKDLGIPKMRVPLGFLGELTLD